MSVLARVAPGAANEQTLTLRAADVRFGLYPIVTLEKQLLNMTERLV